MTTVVTDDCELAGSEPHRLVQCHGPGGEEPEDLLGQLHLHVVQAVRVAQEPDDEPDGALHGR